MLALGAVELWPGDKSCMCNLLPICNLTDSGEPPWSIVGEAETLAQELPYLPELLRKDLWGVTELLLALAGQLGKVGAEMRHPKRLSMYTSGPSVKICFAAM